MFYTKYEGCITDAMFCRGFYTLQYLPSFTTWAQRIQRKEDRCLSIQRYEEKGKRHYSYLYTLLHDFKLKDLWTINKILCSLTGFKTAENRFPGNSVNLNNVIMVEPL